MLFLALETNGDVDRKVDTDVTTTTTSSTAVVPPPAAETNEKRSPSIGDVMEEPLTKRPKPEEEIDT